MTRNAVAPQAPRSASAATPAPSVRQDDEFILTVSGPSPELPEADLTALRDWLADTLRADRRHYLVLGSCAPDSSEQRAQALDALTEHLVALGVAPDTIRCTHDGLQVPAEAAHAAPHQVLRLKAVEGAQMARASVRPISSLFQAG